jgi:hypothetical protein
MKGAAIFLKFIIFLIGLPMLAVCIYGLSRFDPDSAYWALPELAILQYPVLIGMYAAAIPFFFALYQAWRLVGALGNGKVFSPSSVRALRNIKFSALVICLLYALEMPFLYRLTQVDDAPGTIFGLFVIIGSGVIAIFTFFLQKRLQKAMAERPAN